ncbi:MAG: SusC/RagA family TonB-linked outer membrane protein, partial [Sphingobacteriales bacterium]
MLSVNEIQNIDVLKDLASTAIYGARGANGVFIITTKSGKKGRVIVAADAFVGARQISTQLPVMKPYDFVNYQYELSHLHYNAFLVTDTVALNGFKNNYGPTQDLDIYRSFPAVDWQDRIFGRSAMSNNQNISVNGGSDQTLYSVSMNNTNEQGIMLNSGLKRTLASLRLDSRISPKLRVALNARYSRQRVEGVGTSSTGNLKYTLRYQPYQGIVSFEEYDPNAIFDNTINLSNPLTAALSDTRLAYSNNLITSAQVTYNPFKRITLRSTVGYNVSENRNNSFSGVSNVSVSSANSSSQYASQPFINLTSSNGIAINNSNTIDFNAPMPKKNTLNIILGQEINQNDGRSFNQNIKYFPAAVTAEQAFANVQQANPPSGAIQPSPVSDVYGDRLYSFFGRIMYSYKSRYNLNILARRDGSSKFSDKNKWGTFPSAQFAWRMSEEKFIKNLDMKWLSGLKIRASYGTAGNNRVSGDRIYQTTFTTSATSAGYAASDASQTSGLYSANLANPELKWETTVSKDLGLDIDLFNGKVNIAIDGYINRTRDLLLQTNVPQQTGYITQFQNIGATENKGLELQLNATVMKSSDFQWTASFNISSNKNTIKALQGGVDSYLVSSGWGQNGEDFMVQVGKPVGQYYGYLADGFYTVDDFDLTRSNLATST